MRRLLSLSFIIAIFSPALHAQLTFTNQTTPTTEALFGISFADSLTGYAAGDKGTIVKTTNGGNTWTLLTTPVPTIHFWDIRVIPNSGGQKVIASGDNSTIIKSMNGGVTWTVQPIPFAAGSFVFGLQCIDSLNYYACGGDFTTNTGAVLKTTNGGATWTTIASTPSSFFLEKVWMFNSTSGFLAGTGPSPATGAMLKTTNGTAFPTVKSTTNIMTNLWCSSTSNVVGVGIGGLIWKSTDGGATWQDKHLNTTDLYGVAFRDAQRGYACGGISGGIVLSTANGGDTWIQESYTGANLLTNCVAGNYVFFAGEAGKVVRARIATNNAVATAERHADVSVGTSPGTLTIRRGIASAELRFSLVDGSGRTVLTTTVPAGRLTAAVAHNLPSGIYYFSAQSSGDQAAAETGKVFIR